MLTPIRPVQGVIQPQLVLEGAGVLLKRSFPTSRLDYPDPFLLLDHFGSDNPEDYLAGFPTHPHRGIETVTYMLAGAVQHKDSIGNSGRIEAGDVQWMTAGGGILHEEMPQPVEGKMEGFQLWVNLPARLKMTRPQYQEIHAEEIQPLPLPGGGSLRVIAGERRWCQRPSGWDCGRPHLPGYPPGSRGRIFPAGRTELHPARLPVSRRGKLRRRQRQGEWGPQRAQAGRLRRRRAGSRACR